MHCKVDACHPGPTDCACLCEPCAQAKRAEGWQICPVCRRVYFGRVEDKYWHPDGSCCHQGAERPRIMDTETRED